MSPLTPAALRAFTDPELLNEMDERKHQSPILRELCNRLELRLRDEIVTPNEWSDDCPVCQAQPLASLSDTDVFTLKVQE